MLMYADTTPSLSLSFREDFRLIDVISITAISPADAVMFAWIITLVVSLQESSSISNRMHSMSQSV